MDWTSHTGRGVLPGMKSLQPLLALVLTACSSSPPPAAQVPLQTAPQPVAEPIAAPLATPAAHTFQADKETSVTTASGLVIPVAVGWYVTEEASRLTLEDPDHKLKIMVFELEGESSKAAIDEAFTRYDAGLRREVNSEFSAPPEQWDEIVQGTYKVPAETQRMLFANARRKGKHIWTVLIDGQLSAYDKRSAHINQVDDAIKAPGVAETSLRERKALPFDGEKQQVLSSFIEKSRTALGIPGASVVIVQDGKVVFERGFGVRELGKKAPVTPTTPFLIGSTTKGLSTLLMAKAVDDGKFTWETKVTGVMPDFAVDDKALTERMTMRDLVCACTGLPRYDMELIFNFAGVKPESIMSSLKKIAPTTGYREAFQYNNQLVAAGGYLAARSYFPKLSLGDAYDKALREKVLMPLGMKDTTTSFAEARRRGVAGTHGQDVFGNVTMLPFSDEEFVIPLRPSGGVLSSARDMTRYLQSELANGKTSTGTRVASEQNTLIRRQPQIKLSATTSYGLGLMSGTYEQAPIVEHGGSTFGHRSTFFFMPEHGVGLIVLANAPGGLGWLTKTKLLELLFETTPTAEQSLKLIANEQAKEIAKNKQDIKEQPPAEVLNGLAGTYADPALGRIDITSAGGKLILDAGEWKTRLGWQEGKGLIALDAPLAGIPFERIELDGQPAIRLTFGQHIYTFKR